MGSNSMSDDEDLGFAFQSSKGDVLQILRAGKVVTVLRGKNAIRAFTQLSMFDVGAQQQLMARLTGNYKRGNERLSKPFPS